jgi:hypothetical protein
MLRMRVRVRIRKGGGVRVKGVMERFHEGRPMKLEK